MRFSSSCNCDEDVLKEFFVDVDVEGKFQWVLGPPSNSRLRKYLDLCGIALKQGQIAEINLEVERWLRLLLRQCEGIRRHRRLGSSVGELYASSPDNPRYLGTLEGL